ncbi:hypothetical protein POM88_048949 [Heracleum sosnowskyi]|uniref:Uncharacterized protein n=1 Tax=Heracleum sosnowskyi TaxID=360622 RepID=A0AAD8GXB0_9APIA|nr:hypothetical protein POM88_048949 [Heracleum sosnowskyi]
MDYQAPPTPALTQIESSLTPPTNSERTMQNSINLSLEESSQRVLLLSIIRQFYGILMAFPGATLDQSEFIMHVPDKSESRDYFNSVRLQSKQRRIIDELSNMEKDYPEHMESLELAKSYVEQGTNREDVLSIVESVWRSCKV